MCLHLSCMSELFITILSLTFRHWGYCDLDMAIGHVYIYTHICCSISICLYAYIQAINRSNLPIAVRLSLQGTFNPTILLFCSKH